MKFVVDQQLPPKLAKHLCWRGLDCIHVRDRQMTRTADPAIWTAAIAEHLIVISKDGDFVKLIGRPGDHGRLVWVRLGNCPTKAILHAFDKALPRCLAALEAGDRLVEIP